MASLTPEQIALLLRKITANPDSMDATGPQAMDADMAASQEAGPPDPEPMSPGMAAFKLVKEAAEQGPQDLIRAAPHTLGQAALDAAMLVPQLRIPAMAASTYFNMPGSANAGEDTERVKDLQQKMRDAGYYGNKIDGVNGPDTQRAKEKYDAAMAKQQDYDLKKAAADKAVKDSDNETARLANEKAAAERRAAEREAGNQRIRDIDKNTSPIVKGLRDNSEMIGTVLGLGAGGYVRSKVAKGAERTSAKVADSASKLMEDMPADVPGRVGRLNSFWEQGGAGKNIPFPPSPRTPKGFKSSPDAPSATELYQPPGIRDGQLTTNDALGAGGFAAETGISTAFKSNAEDRLAKAKEAVNKDPTEANIAELNTALNLVSFFGGTQRMGVGGMIGYGGVASKGAPKYSRPDTSKAETERIRLDSSATPKPAPKFVPGVPAAPKSGMSAKELSDGLAMPANQWLKANPNKTLSRRHVLDMAKEAGVEMSPAQASTVATKLQKAYGERYINAGAKSALSSRYDDVPLDKNGIPIKPDRTPDPDKDPGNF